MPDDDFDLYPGDNRPEDVKLDAEIMSILEEYAALDTQSGVINMKRAKLRKKADDRGIPSLALQESVRKLKKFSKAERLDHERVVKRVLKAAEGRQTELWPDEVAKADKGRARKAEKAAKAKAKAAEAKAASIEAGDDNPRSDPNKGGAKPMTAEEVMTGEQAEGAAILDGGLAGIKARAGVPSQSAQAAAVRDKLGLDK